MSFAKPKIVSRLQNRPSKLARRLCGCNCGWSILKRRALRRAMLLAGVREFHPETIDWELREGGLSDRFRGDLTEAAREALALDRPADLFQFCLSNTAPQPRTGHCGDPVRPRDGVLGASGIDIEELVRPLLIKLSSVFLDQGFAYWPMPNREQGLWRASVQILGQSFGVESAGHRKNRVSSQHRRGGQPEAQPDGKQPFHHH